MATGIDDAPSRDLLAWMALAPGRRVLDVSPGGGDVARWAAAADADVVALDWDAGPLPFASGSFDRVLSAFGTQFAERPAAVAQELARVCRPGGRLGLLGWTARTDDEERIRRLFAPAGVELAFARGRAQRAGTLAEYLLVVGFKR